MPTRYIGDGYWEIASRQMSIVTRSEQERFKDAKITVIGCGGIGGETIEMLARMGIGELVLVDKDAFDLSNLNRQTLASIADLGLDKSAVAAEKAVMNIGIIFSQLVCGICDQFDRIGLACADIHRAGHIVIALPDLLLGLIHKLHDLLGTLAEDHALLGQRNAFVGTDQERFSKFIFQFLQLTGQRRL
jgi:hypothetical protein